MAAENEKTGALSESQISHLVESISKSTAEVSTRAAFDVAAKILEMYATELDKAQINMSSEPARQGAETALRAVAADMRIAAKSLRAGNKPSKL
jgi:hypothetical protein